MYKSLLLLSAFLLSFAHHALAQCSVTVTPTNTNVCLGQSFTLTATTGGDSYVWTVNGTPVVGGTTEVLTMPAPNNPGTYTYSVEVVFGTCTANAFATVTVISPQVVAGSNVPTVGGPLNLTATTIPGATYQWVGPNLFSSNMQNPTINNVQCLNSGTYTVTATVNGCMGMSTVTVTLMGFTPVEATNNGPVCAGDLLNLMATSITGATYLWTGPNGFTSTLQNPSFTVGGPADGGIYTVQSNENGCISTDTTLVMLCNTIFISNYTDVNNNCLYESGTDNYMAQPVEIQIDSNGVIIDTITSIGGLYYAPYGTAGDVYTFTVIDVPTGMVTSCPISGSISHTLTNSVSANLAFGFECDNFTDYDLAISASNPTSGAVWQTGFIYATNDYCTPVNATVTLTHSPQYQYSYSYPAATSVSGNVITWDITNLSNDGYPYSIFYSLHSNPVPLIAGDTVHSYYTIEPSGADVDPSNNSYFHIDTVIASYDPNAITAFPATCVQAGTKMQYTIQFENVGNAPAEDIYVLDTLPADLEMNTMKLLMSSHNMFVTKIQDGGYNILRFDFPNINLPDSSDHAGCHGQLVYSIDLNSNLPFGAEVYHKAGIYFDYNAVVMTNNERTTICIPQNVTTTTKDGNTMLYPNPAGDELTLQTNGTFTGYTITNSIGQTMLDAQIKDKQTRIDIHSLAPGIYYININGAQNNEVLKFVKK